MVLSKSMTNKMLHYIDAQFPIIYVNTFEEMKADGIIAEVAKYSEKKVIEWDAANGLRQWNIGLDGITKCHLLNYISLEDVLNFLNVGEELKQKILVIKDGHHFFDNLLILSILKNIAHGILSGLEATIIIVAPILLIPPELEKYITIFEIEHMESNEIREYINEFTNSNYMPEIPSKLLDEMSVAFKGLSAYEIDNILALAYANDGCFKKNDLELINDQKKQIVKRSGILEMITVEETLEDIGGLENLKGWLMKKEKVFKDLNRAKEFGVDVPKGVLIAGLPGCGKSLSAKAAAKLFAVPLLRLDMGRLLGKYVGESEANMRKAISLAEAISPCILWIDELEKAFAGIGEAGSGAEVTTRLFGNFLTWMQEKTTPSFVVATANDIFKLPPELMRKGRFDEIFYVGLPNDEERRKIFEIHITKRHKKDDLPSININELVQNTVGYSGADIEGVVKDSIETVFVEGKPELKTSDILDAIKNTHSLSEIMKEPLEKMIKECETRKLKNASV